MCDVKCQWTVHRTKCCFPAEVFADLGPDNACLCACLQHSGEAVDGEGEGAGSKQLMVQVPGTQRSSALHPKADGVNYRKLLWLIQKFW